MSSKKRITCSGCHRRISQSEPDLLLRKLGSDTFRRFYHQQERCAGKMHEYMLANPTVWRITTRSIDPEAN